MNQLFTKLKIKIIILFFIELYMYKKNDHEPPDESRFLTTSVMLTF